MKRYWLVVLALLGIMLAVYLAASALGLALEDPRPLLSRGGVAAALVSSALLVADVVAPIPASLIMLANGAVFGLAAGAALSLAGSLTAFVLAFAIGRRGGPLLGRLVGLEERRRAGELLARHGAVAVAATRPVPILAETTALLAGASELSWASALLAAIVGILPQAILYGLAGALAVSFVSGSLVFVAVIAATALLWLLVERRKRSAHRDDPGKRVA